LAQAIEGSMMLRSSRAAASSSPSARRTASRSRAARQSSSFATRSISTCSDTVAMARSAPAASGEGSVSVKALTPTTVSSPDSMARMRAVLDATSSAFM
jgi:hypothetical protein